MPLASSYQEDQATLILSSLGGVASSVRVRGMAAIFDLPLPAFRLDNVLPACGEGDASLAQDVNGDLVFTPPGGVAGTPVTVIVGESKIIAGIDPTKAIVVFREPILPVTAGLVSTLGLVDAQNGALGMEDVTDAQRTAGVTTYRAVLLQAQGLFSVLNTRLWMPPVGGAQGVFSIGTEVAVGNTIQTVANELIAPAAVSFVTPTTEGAALTIPVIGPGDYVGLWIRKVFPIGTVAPNEEFQLAMKYLGA